MKRYIHTLITFICIISYFGCGDDKTPAGWGQIESGTEAHLYGVHFIDAKRGWAVGTDGLVLFTEDGGLKWQVRSPQKAITPNALNKVHFSTPNNGWAVSIRGQIHYTGSGGKSWTAQKSNTDNGLLDIYFADETEGWAVGGSGAILHTNNGGGTWTRQNTPPAPHSVGCAFFRC